MNKLSTICAKVALVSSIILSIRTDNRYCILLSALFIVICITYLELSKED